MGDNSKRRRIRRQIEKARSSINAGKALRAIELLKKFKDEIGSHSRTPEDVDYSLAQAEAHAAMHNESEAERSFEEAAEKASGMQDPTAEFGVRLYMHLGDYYSRARKPVLARSSYERAKSFAVQANFEDDIAEIDMKFECIDLQEEKELLELENLKKLKKVADGDSAARTRESFTCAEQKAAWNIHKGLPRDARFARIPKERDETYFLNLLRSVRKDQEANGDENRGEQLDLFR